MTWLACAFGAAGIFAEWVSYARRDAKNFRRWSAAAALLWAGQYAAIGASTAAVTMAATALRTAWSGRDDTPRAKAAGLAAFVALFAGAAAFAWQGPVSLLPLFAVVNTTVALFVLSNVSMRVALLASSAAWIANDVIWGAWPALVAEIVAVAISLRTIAGLRAAARSAPTIVSTQRPGNVI